MPAWWKNHLTFAEKGGRQAPSLRCALIGALKGVLSQILKLGGITHLSSALVTAEIQLYSAAQLPSLRKP